MRNDHSSARSSSDGKGQRKQTCCTLKRVRVKRVTSVIVNKRKNTQNNAQQQPKDNKKRKVQSIERRVKDRSKKDTRSAF